jgi:hypothetical protein
MLVKHKNKGVYVPYALEGTTLSFRDGALVIDMVERQCGYPLRLDISEDETGGLVTGPAYRYVAELEIPARQYRLNYKGYADDLGIVQAYRTAVPLDLSEAVLTLWALEEE